MAKQSLGRRLAPLSIGAFLLLAGTAHGQLQLARQPSIIHKVRAASERLEMTVNSSRILSTEQKIPQAQVNNPDILDLTPLSPTEIQVSAKSTGVTQINLWDDQQNVTTIDVIVFADARELEYLLKSQFPQAALRVVPVANGVLISGYVDRPEHVGLISRIAEEYYPKVINNISVGGVQQVLLHVKVMEVSRTKLRDLGFDWVKLTGGNVVASGISGLLQAAGGVSTGPATSGTQTFQFNIVNGSAAFFGLLEALRQDNLAKILAEPTLVTVSGRPASFNVGGEIPVPVPQSLGTISIEYKKYGTQLDFVPIVLGNGQIRLEVRPRVSEIDPSRSVTIASTTVPGLRSREVETGVEMKAGQTLAIAGLVQVRTEALNRGLPWISEVPYLGVPFRRVHEETNEIELLILVTPELVEAMDANQVPPCGPGTMTTSPDDCELFLKGHIEVPNCCPGGQGCQQCQPGGAMPGSLMPMGGPGMILGPGQELEEPRPADPSGRPLGFTRPLLPSRATVLQSGSRLQSRQIPSRTNGGLPASSAPNQEPAFIGPIGYDVVR
jgi:pilus assembly protein CpaC